LKKKDLVQTTSQKFPRNFFFMFEEYQKNAIYGFELKNKTGQNKNVFFLTEKGN